MSGSRVGRVRRLVAGAAIVLLLPFVGASVRSAVGAAPADTVINFDNLSDGTQLSTQYKGSGITFSGGIVRAADAHSAPNSVEVDGSCEEQNPSTSGSFFSGHQRVRAYVGSNGRADTEITLTAFDANGNAVASAKVDVPAESAGANTAISVSVSSATIASFTLTSNQSCEPLYYDDLAFDTPSATLSVTVDPSTGGTVTGSGISCPSDCSEPYALGYQVQLTAAADTADGYTFAGWGGGCASAGTNTICNVAMNSDVAVTATFTAPNLHTLTVTATGDGTVTGTGIACPGDCSEQYADGSSVTLVATPGSNATFTGWGGACSGTGDCTVTLNADESVSATFTGKTPPPTGGAAQRPTLSVAVSGSGSVSSSPAGINACRSSCSATFDSGASVTLTASPDANATLTGWGGACSGAGACTVTMSGNKSVTASFSSSSATLNPAVVQDPVTLPPEVTLSTANPADPSQVVEVEAGETGNGVITQVGRTTAAANANRIACGFTQFNCYTRLTPGTTLLLRAKPQPGYVFRGWNGSCQGQGPLCRIVARSLVSTTALFLPRNPAESLGLVVNTPRIRVKWALSTGTGTITVFGRVGGKVGLLLQVRRPGGGVLERARFTARARFTRTLRLPKDILPRGARLFPGAFVASLRGVKAADGLPLVVRPLVVPAPREGVVRQAFASAVQGGPPTLRLPSGSHQAWANFQLQTQPSLKLPLTIRWYRPDGSFLNSMTPSNRPEMTSVINGGSAAIASGTWVAELRAGPLVVKRLSVRIG
jgi:uncharacterized repeat protein (TIGR02543 family)